MIPTRVYLLAAGRGRRAGGPKAWLLHEGTPLLARHARFLASEIPDADVVVSIQPAWRSRCEAIAGAITWVDVNPDDPPFAALRALLDRVPLTRWSFVYHVDMPLWDRGLFEALAARVPEADARGADAIVPEHRGRGGHPVLVGPRAAPSLLATDASSGRLDRWLAGRTVVRAPVEDAHTLENWNAGVPEPDEER